ncbi:transcription termination/antitermination NusG family protein [Pelagicoccus sp. SDUM812002]|uniref:transcription termination/antitermination protein NusG n=1 Tax=Pelagicoccus sp. SDUM812002 TaxID=3041266 RepID=UPI00280C9770|nr:transcription termination/antitermination NusG family protein [Pelagicoccus sp. SDUM812002]MDQ8188497.1 transcription termination/antitermination NusG family protein [Pelagicoccus sp. SDUM812002]
MSWYCVRSHQKKEHIAARCISDEIQVETFCPRISRVKRTRSGKKRFVDAMFPCYTFANLDLEAHLQKIRSVRGVSRLLTYGSHYPVVPDDFIQAMREELHDDVLHIAEREFKAPAKVQITRGPFQGLICELVRASSGGERLNLLLELFGSNVSVNVSAVDIQLIAV